ncbi:MAG TPA: hypothetical protein VF297_14850 [Pyrinomonadaceae bacterium]
MNRNRVRGAFACAALVASLGLAEVSAQVRTGPPSPPPPGPTGGVRSSTMRVELPMPPVAETPVPLVDDGRDGRLNTLSFTTPDASFGRNVVKGSPFTAESVTEHVQRLADGNRMVRKSAAKLFRDSSGRTRREHALTRGNVTAASDGQEPRLIVINDPVGQVEYLVDTARGTLRKMRVTPMLAEARRQMSGTESSFGVLMPTSAAHRRRAEGDAAQPLPEPKKERLETQQIEGVMAEGTRITVTIPAGEFDNEQPLEITHEQWYSPELQMVVLLKHNDPRFGETTFRLTNITRGDPAPDLFAEPRGYRAVDQHEPVFGRPVMRRP